jgi:branched-chain amino acid transport system permease protein
VTRRPLLPLGVAAVLLAAPLAGVDDYYLHLMIMAGIFFILAAGMNLVLAGGQLNLGHTAFFGIGAYTSGLLALHFGIPSLLAMAGAGVLSGALGFLLGRLTLRLRGAYFVLVTTGFAEVIRLVATNWMDLTQGPMGLPGIPALDLGMERLALAGKLQHYYFMAALAGATLLLTARLLHSRVGRALRAIRSNEPLAESSGISPYRHTMLALVVACVLAGLAGGFYAHYISFLSPELFGFQNTVTMAVMVVGGGQGTVLGPAVGALVFTFLPEFLRMAAFYRMLLYGVILLLVVMFMPRGLVFAVARFRRARPAAATAPDGLGAAAPAGGPAPAAAATGDPPLALRDITVHFGGLAAVQDVSLQLGRREILGLIGPNGAGKSTVFNVITGFQATNGGHVLLEGADVTGHAPFEIADRGLVRMFQRTSVFPESSVVDNVLTACHHLARTGLAQVMLGTPASRREERTLVDRARALVRFVGLDHKADETARNLSCGEQRLLGLAIALAPDPSVLLLDEPAAGLNATETARLMQLITEIRGRGVSVLIVEHDMALVMNLCDRVVVLNHGQHIAEGAPPEVQRNPEVVRAYLGSGDVYAHA